MKKWRFEPGKADGRAVESRAKYTFNF